MKIFALILAGGQGSRMGGVDKGLVQWHNKALIDHVIEKSARKSAISPSVPTAISNPTPNAARTFSPMRANGNIMAL